MVTWALVAMEDVLLEASVVLNDQEVGAIGKLPGNAVIGMVTGRSCRL